MRGPKAQHTVSRRTLNISVNSRGWEADAPEGTQEQQQNHTSLYMDGTVTVASGTVYAPSSSAAGTTQSVPFSGLRRLSEPISPFPFPGNGKHESSPLLHSHGLSPAGALQTSVSLGSNTTTHTGGHAILAEASYCLISAGTILFNKHTLSAFGFPAPNALLLFQFLQVSPICLKSTPQFDADHGCVLIKQICLTILQPLLPHRQTRFFFAFAASVSDLHCQLCFQRSIQ